MIDITSRQIQSIDSRKNIVICESEKQAIQFSVSHWIKLARDSVAKKGSFQVALSGGSTPKKMFQALCSSPFQEKVPWESLFLFWSDERAVPPEDENSNFHMAMQAGFQNMPIDPKHIFRMRAEEEIKKNALEYEQILKKNLFEQTFDLVMLGMGEDGHTASLFPESSALNEKKRLVVANYLPEKNTWRMTLTFRAINDASRNIAFYVLGSSKKKMLKNVLFPEKNTPTYPAQLIGSSKVKALWITDIYTAELLKT